MDGNGFMNLHRNNIVATWTDCLVRQNVAINAIYVVWSLFMLLLLTTLNKLLFH